MNKRNIKYDDTKLKEMKYRPCPILQINNLPDLKAWHKTILISLFGHSNDFNLYGEGYKRIAESFTPALNSSRVKIYMEEMIQWNYILVTDSNYIINLELIQKNTKVTNRNYLVTDSNYLVTDSNYLVTNRSTKERILKKEEEKKEIEKEKKKEILKKENRQVTISNDLTLDSVIKNGILEDEIENEFGKL